MAMNKRFGPDSWPFDQPAAVTIKCASTGLRGQDRKDFIKRAGAASDLFLPYLDRIKIASDEHPIHLIGLGATEAWGANRNGDGFSEEACKRYHDTFVKYAKFYRNHLNKRPEISYGTIKFSAYNPEMRRVELIVGLNKTKEAAERNKGLVADKEMQKLASGKDLAVSMAARVPNDRCDACGNIAATREDYCKEATCSGVGCAENLTKLYKQGNDIRQQFVHNDQPTFFDMTHVESDRPADRIAYGNTAHWLNKEAAFRDIFELPGAKAAEMLGLTAPLPVLLAQRSPFEDPLTTAQVKVAFGLDMLESKAPPADHFLRAISPRQQPPIDFASLGVTQKNAADFLAALADREIILPLRDFAALTKRAEVADMARDLMPGIYGRMLTDDSIDSAIANCKYSPLYGKPSPIMKVAALKLAPMFSLGKEAAMTRGYASVLRGEPVPVLKSEFGIKRASDYRGQAGELAKDYAIYKTASLARMMVTGVETSALLTSSLAVCQDRIS